MFLQQTLGGEVEAALPLSELITEMSYEAKICTLVSTLKFKIT